MPWCEPCEQFFNPASLGAEGECPQCGEQPETGAMVEKVTAKVGASQSASADASQGASEGKLKIPWHFWLLCIATAGYMLWRFIQLGMRFF